MMNQLLFVVLLGSNALAEKLEPTRVQWCETLFGLADRQPAAPDVVGAALTAAERDLHRILADLARGADQGDIPARDADVDTNLHHRTAAEYELKLRQSAARLAGLRAELARPDALAFARVDVGSDEILKYLDALDARARRKQRATGEDEANLAINPKYALRSLLTVGGLGGVTLGCTTASLHLYGVNDHQWAFFTSGGVLGAWEFGKAIVAYGAEFRSPAARVRLENTYNDARVDVEPDALKRMRSLAAHPHLVREPFAHHGYATRVSTKTADDLVARRRPATPSDGGVFKIRRDPVEIVVDHVLFRDADDRPVLLTTGRVTR